MGSDIRTYDYKLSEPDFVKVLQLSKQTNMYAYDAYFLDCAIRHKAPLLTLSCFHMSHVPDGDSRSLMATQNPPPVATSKSPTQQD